MTLLVVTMHVLSSHDLAGGDHACLSIENEYHFLLVCPIYIELRRNYFRPFCRWPTLNKFDQIMSSENKIEVNKKLC